MRFAKTAVLACALAGIAVPSVMAESLGEFMTAISGEPELSSASVAVIDLSGKEPVRAGIRAGEMIYPASVIKLAMLSAAYDREASHPGFISQEVVIDTRNMTGTWEPEPKYGDTDRKMEAGQTWTVRDILRVMITRSDNIATNTMIDLLVRQKITEYMKSIGINNTTVFRKPWSDYPVSDPTEEQYQNQSNTMPAADAAEILYRIASGRMVSEAASAEMFALLAKQLDRDLIATALPKDAQYAGKTGETSRVKHDASIVTGPGRHYVLVVYTNHDTEAKRIEAIHKTARLVDGYFVRRAAEEATKNK